MIQQINFVYDVKEITFYRFIELSLFTINPKSGRIFINNGIK
jgi:hypothetical protein